MAIISYAQNHEDVLLQRLFRESPSGFYIDVGACHPVVHSVTKLFYERGWHGINIEPILSLSEMLARERPRDINLRIGLSNRQGTSTLYECPTGVGLSTFSEEQALDLRRQGYELVEHSTPVTTLAALCEQYADRTIDFLKIDVEGFEQEVLEGADWSRYRPRVVVVEATRPTTNIASYEHWEPILLAADYLFAFFDGLNRYYVAQRTVTCSRCSACRQTSLMSTKSTSIIDKFKNFATSSRQVRNSVQEHNWPWTRSRPSLTRRGSPSREFGENWMVRKSHFADFRLDSTPLKLSLRPQRLSLRPPKPSSPHSKNWGPSPLAWRGRLRHASRQAPRLASIAKRMIRLAFRRRPSPGSGCVIFLDARRGAHVEPRPTTESPSFEG